MRPAVFLDRDGVLVADGGGADAELAPLPGVAAALARLAGAGYALHVVTNQPAVARGWTSPERIAGRHRELAGRIRAAGGPEIDGWHVCPHHPAADLPQWRADCPCRKPRPGLLTAAAAAHGLDLAASVMVGDRPSDVAAGVRAGCRTVQVLSGRHADAPIASPDPPRQDERPDHVCADLAEAAAWICAR